MGKPAAQLIELLFQFRRVGVNASLVEMKLSVFARRVRRRVDFCCEAVARAMCRRRKSGSCKTCGISRCTENIFI